MNKHTPGPWYVNTKGVTVNLTYLEYQMLTNIARNEMTPLNGAEPDTAADCICYADSLENGPYPVRSRQIGPLVSQLVQKGLALTDGENIALTQAGFEAYKSIKPEE